MSAVASVSQFVDDDVIENALGQLEQRGIERDVATGGAAAPLAAHGAQADAMNGDVEGCGIDLMHAVVDELRLFFGYCEIRIHPNATPVLLEHLHHPSDEILNVMLFLARA